MRELGALSTMGMWPEWEATVLQAVTCGFESHHLHNALKRLETVASGLTQTGALAKRSRVRVPPIPVRGSGRLGWVIGKCTGGMHVRGTAPSLRSPGLGDRAGFNLVV